MQKLKITSIVAVALTLLSGFIKTPFMQQPKGMLGTYTNYGLPFPWLFINRTTHPITHDWYWFIIVIDIILWILLFWIILRVKENKEKAKLAEAKKKAVEKNKEGKNNA